MLACSLGDRRRGIVNGNPNRELPASPRPGREMDLQGRPAPLPGTLPAGSLGHIPDDGNPTFSLFSLCPEGPHPTTPHRGRLSDQHDSSRHPVQGLGSFPALNKGLETKNLPGFFQLY